eukprot:1148812-Pelagomonas_calceolata.AAC.16
MGIRKVTGSTWLQNLTVRSIIVNNSTSSGMKFAIRFNGTLVVKSQLFKVVQGIPGVTGPTNTQKGVYAPLVCTESIGLSDAGSCVGPVWDHRDAVPATKHMA